MNVRLLLLIPAVLLALSNTPAPAQSIVAWTVCRGTTVASFVNVSVLGTDSTEEILTHESVHRRQATDSAAARGFCPALEPRQMLGVEAEAYCVSDSVRVRVKGTPAVEASAITLRRLLSQFSPTIPADTIAAEWKRVCP